MSVTNGLVAGAADAGTLNAENPWPGLLPFSEADKSFFQGRDAETAELLRIVLRERLTVLFGLSGLGKSSLLQAGLFPALRNEVVYPVYIRLDFARPIRNLASQVLEAVTTQAPAWEIESPVPRARETLWEYFHRQDADFWDRRNRPVVPLLIFDQFEEVFTQGHAYSEHTNAVDAFISELADLAEGSPPVAVAARVTKHPIEAENFYFGRHHYKLLLVIREDFLPDLEGLRQRISGVALNRMRLKRMNGDAALLAVNQAPHLIDNTVAEKVVRFVGAGQPGVALKNLEVEPALLSLVCRELNNKRKDRGDPKITADLLEGKQEEILDNFYERSFVDVPNEVRVFVEEHLLDAAGFRDNVALVNALTAPAVTRDAIDRLVERRLVRIEDLGGERLELTHDRLTEVVRSSRDRRRQFETKRQEEAARLKAEERERQQRTLERARRAAWVAAAFLVLAVFAVVMAVLAFKGGQEAERLRVLAEDKASYAKQQEALANDQTRIANGKAKEASDAATQAEAAKGRAEAERQKAAASKQEADNQRAVAVVARKKADDEAVKARKSAENETAAKLTAEQNAEAATTSAANAVQKTEEALQAQQNLKRSLARSEVLEASRRLDLNRPYEALAYLARALKSDSHSLAAQSFIFDLLLRGGLSSGIEPLPRSGTANNSFAHPKIEGSGPVISARFSPDPDGSRILTASEDGTARLWNAANGQMIREFKGHKQRINSAMFSNNGLLFVTASQDSSAKVWDVETGQSRELKHDRPVIAASFSLDDLHVITASWDKNAIVWDSATGRQLRRLPHPAPVTSAAFDISGNRVVTACWDKTARIWDLASLTSIELGHNSQVNSAAFSIDGRVVTASEDGTAQVWSGKDPIGAPLRHKGPVNSAVFSSDGRRVVTASDDKTARLWEADTGAPISVPLMHADRVSSAAFSKDGRRVVTASYDKEAMIWEVRDHSDDADLLANFAEAVAGYQADRLPDLVSLQDRRSLLESLRRRAQVPSGQDTTLSFMRWFFTDRSDDLAEV